MTEVKFARLAKDSKKDAAALAPYKLAVLGDCATQHLATALKGWAYGQGIGLGLFDADYDQVLFQAMDPGSELYAFGADAVLLQLCTERLYESWCAAPMEERTDFADSAMGQVRDYWRMISANSGMRILQFTYVEVDDAVFGSYAAKVEASFLFQLRRLNLLLMEGAADAKNVFLVDLNGVQTQCGRAVFFDPALYHVAKMPLALAVLPEVAKRVVDVIKALMGRIYKCVVLDLDNTLWGGVIGDDGLAGIQIGQLGTGHAFTELQLWLKELTRRGVILAVCSKNNEDTAKEPFEKHSEMVLHLEDIAMFVANWEDKAGNIRAIQQTLNIGMDSMVFLDDNPFERELVKSLIPEITVPELPEDPALYLDYLKGLNLFETASYSAADSERTKQYRAEADSAQLRHSYENLDDYLKSLNMQAVAAPFEPLHYARIAQLTQRSNQFNLRTVRYTEAEVERLAGDAGYYTLYFTLRDKLVDHGLISVVVLQKQPDGTLFADTWLMSCRVLKRGMEEFIVDTVMALAKSEGYARVVGEYLPTPKNAMVADIYARMGFEDMGQGRFCAECAVYQPHQGFIQRVEK